MAFCRTSSSSRWPGRALGLLGVLALGSLGCSQGGPATPPPLERTATGQTASEVLQQMVAAYRQTDRYSDHANYVLEVVRRAEGVKRQDILFDLSLALERPNKIRFHHQRMVPPSRRNLSIDVVSNGEVVRSRAGELPEQVHEVDAPETLTPENFIPEPHMRDTVLRVSVENIYPQLPMLLASGDAASPFPDDGNPHLLGQEKLHGHDCHRVALDSTEGRRVLWIDVETHALRRMKLPTEAQLSSLDPRDEFSHYSVWIDYLDPALGAEIDDAAFTHVMPEGARRVRKLVFPPPPAPPAILGQPVAPFSFTTLEGEEVTPATLAGKLVLMEFWSKTCPPCRQHTPLLSQVYQELKDSEDFLFYAVNANLAADSNETIARLFESWGGSIPLLRDLQETSYTKLGISAYPHTIIIGRDGRLQMYQPGMHVRGEPLVEAVHKLLEGGDLAAEAHAKHDGLVQEYEQELEAATIKDVSLESNANLQRTSGIERR